MGLFLDIIEGKIPCYKIYENEWTYSFLSLDQIQKGHTLVIPKVEVDYFVEVPEPYYSEVFKSAKIISKAIHESMECKRVGTMIQGWDVPHFHYHLVPMHLASDLSFKHAKRYPQEVMEEIQEKIISHLKN